MDNVSFKVVKNENMDLIRIIANWYYKEWHIPVNYTFKRLSNTPNQQVLFQLMLLTNNKPTATGGLYNRVGLIKKHPRFSKLSPWVALLYTVDDFRNLGFGTQLLKKIETLAKQMDLRKIYLHTFSAEKFYLKYNWNPVNKASYKGHTTIVMEKDLRSD